MKKLASATLVWLMSLYSVGGHAVNVVDLDTNYQADKQQKLVSASFGGDLAPWVMKTGPSGILIDLLKECLAPAGYKVNAKLHPYARRIVEYQSGNVDVVSDINQKIITNRQLTGYYTGNIYAYENFLFSLTEKGFQVNKIEQLSDYSLISWQGAIAHIGGNYAAMAKNNKKYSETHNQKTQLRMLFSKRVDFIQMDGQIYEHYRKEIETANELDVSLPVTIQPFFGKSPNGFLFKSKDMRDACVNNLETIKVNNKYKGVLYFGG